MNMSLNITFSAPEVVGALNNIAAALSGAAALHIVSTPVIAKPAKEKLVPVAKEVAIVPSAADLPADPLANDETPTVEPPTVASTPAPAASLTADTVKTLAAQKAKKTSAAVVKGIIADTGFATIADITDPLVLASLAANLEAL